MRITLLAALALAAALAAAAPAPFSGLARAVTPEEQLDDPELEARARKISKGLRCVVCDNQSIDESEASVAAAMRKLVRSRLVAGDSDREVEDRLVAAYGEYVLLKPRFSLSNLILWIGPLLALGGGIWWVRSRIRAEPKAAAAAPVETAAPLTPEEQAKLDALLAERKD